MRGSHLAIEIAEHAFRFTELENGSVLNEIEFAFDSEFSREKRIQLEDIFTKNDFLNKEFNEVTLSFATKKTTLVPNSIFDASNPKAVFELCYGKQPDDSSAEIDHNRIFELGLVNIFELPDWIKRFFVTKYPRIIIQHEGTHVLRKIGTINASLLNVVLLVYSDYFQLLLAKDNKLEFYSTFDIQSHEDILYYLLYTMQQKEMVNEKGDMLLVLGAGGKKQLADDFLKNYSRIPELSELICTTPSNYIAKAELLCV